MALSCIRVCHAWERAIVLCGLVVLLALVPLAYVSPPDPLWIAGIYDAADADDVVQAITDGDGLPLSANHGPSQVNSEPSPTPILFDVRFPPTQRPLSSVVDRAPPHI